MDVKKIKDTDNAVKRRQIMERGERLWKGEEEKENEGRGKIMYNEQVEEYVYEEERKGLEKKEGEGRKEEEKMEEGDEVGKEVWRLNKKKSIRKKEKLQIFPEKI